MTTSVRRWAAAWSVLLVVLLGGCAAGGAVSSSGPADGPPRPVATIRPLPAYVPGTGRVDAQPWHGGVPTGTPAAVGGALLTPANVARPTR